MTNEQAREIAKAAINVADSYRGIFKLGEISINRDVGLISSDMICVLGDFLKIPNIKKIDLDTAPFWLYFFDFDGNNNHTLIGPVQNENSENLINTIKKLFINKKVYLKKVYDLFDSERPDFYETYYFEELVKVICKKYPDRGWPDPTDPVGFYKAIEKNGDIEVYEHSKICYSY